MTDARDDLATLMGILPRYGDQNGVTHDLSPATRDALLAAMGIDPADAAAELQRRHAAAAGRPVPVWQVVVADAPLSLPALTGRDWQLRSEDGDPRDGHGPDLGTIPLGIHALRVGEVTGWLLSAPRTLPAPPRSWGVTLPLYGLDPEGGIGTYGQLAAMTAPLGRAGAAFVGVNPIHAGFPTDAQATSPYSPSHRGRLSVLHLDAGDATPGIDGLIDYAAAIPARLAAIGAGWADAETLGMEDWIAGQGPDLALFCLHQALADRFGPYWMAWPEAYRTPDGAAARAFARDNPDAVRYFAWLQWRAATALADVQRAATAAGMRFGLYLDLAVGTHPSGAETWGDPQLFARGVSLGAPPDAFSADGQSWGLAPLRPDTLAQRGFQPLARILRAQMAHAKLLRIDHILGFERAFWVPDAAGVPGAYVQMPVDAMMAVIRIEATRAGASVVGEDLGNIPDGLQAALEGSGILGCRVAMFEQDWDAARPHFLPADAYTSAALTSFSTHDLPTWQGWRAGRDIDWRHRLGSMDEAARDAAKVHRRHEVAALEDRIDGHDSDALHAFLAATPSRLVAVLAEDILGRVEQANLPGTVDTHPNWRRPLGVTPDDPAWTAGLQATARLMQQADR